MWGGRKEGDLLPDGIDGGLGSFASLETSDWEFQRKGPMRKYRHKTFSATKRGRLKRL